jgi:hypothetical protein
MNSSTNNDEKFSPSATLKHDTTTAKRPILIERMLIFVENVFNTSSKRSSQYLD